MNTLLLHYYYYALCTNFIRLIRVNIISCLYQEVEIFTIVITILITYLYCIHRVQMFELIWNTYCNTIL